MDNIQTQSMNNRQKYPLNRYGKKAEWFALENQK